MTCKVTVTGKNKDRFKALSNKFGQRAALQSILDADPNIEIEGFISDVEIANRVNSLSFFVLNSLIRNGGNNHILDLDSKTFEVRYFQKALVDAQNSLEKIITDSIIEIEEGKNVSENTHKVTRAYVTMVNFNKLVPKIREKLKNYKLRVSEMNNDLEDIVNDEETEDIKERIYAMSAIERNRLDSVSADVKMYISSLSKKVKNENGEVIEVLDDLGMTIPVDFISIWSVLSKNLANKSTFEDMLETLRGLADTNPNIEDILQDLENGTLESNKTSIKVFGREMKSFENAFFSAFSNTLNRSITVTTETKKDTEGKTVKSNIYDTNSKSIDKTLFNRWQQNLLIYKNTSLKDKQELWKNTLYVVFNKKNQNKYREQLNSNNVAVLVEVKEALRYIGIETTVAGLSALRKEMNRGKRKDAKLGTFGHFVTTGQGSIAFMAEEFWSKGKNIYSTESSNIQKIAKAQASVTSDIAAESFRNGKGNTIYPINLPTAASDLFSEFTAQSNSLTQIEQEFEKGSKELDNAVEEFYSRNERLQQFLNDPLTSHFRLLQGFIDGSKGHGELGILDTYYNNDVNEGLAFDELDPASAIMTRFKAFQNYTTDNKPDKKAGWFMVPTPSDRSGTSMVKLDRLSLPRMSFNGVLNDGDFIQWAKDTVKGELVRIRQVRDEFNSQPNIDRLIANYHYKEVKNSDGSKSIVLGNGGYFNSYPELNQFLVENEGGELVTDTENVEFINELKKALISQIKQDFDYFEKIGLINPIISNGGVKVYADIKPSDKAKKMIGTDFNEDSILSFIVNSIVATHELSTIINGDLAFFKPFNEKTGIQDSQLADANKRAGLAYTPGTKLHVSRNGARENFNVAFLKDFKIASDLYEQYSEVIGDNAKKYLGTEVTDGQGICSLSRYAEILGGQGLLTSEMAKTINELRKTNPEDINWDNVTEPLQPIKGFLQGMRFDPVFGRMMPKNLKYSLIPVIPANVKNNPTMQLLYNKMVDANVDEAVFVSGSKFSAYNINDLNSEDKLDIVQMSNRDWRVPQIVPYKTKTEENFGTQIRKLIMGNLDLKANYGNKNGSELQSQYHKAISTKLANSLKELYRSFMDSDEISKAKIAQQVIKDLSKNSFKSTSDFVVKGLSPVKLPDGTIDTRIPMSFPSIKHRVESSLNSIVRRTVTKQSLPGFAAVQYTALGFGKESIQKSTELKFVRLSEDKSTVLPAEVIMSPQYFIQTLRKKLEEEQKLSNPNTDKITAILDTIDQLKRWEFDINKLPQSLREVVIYRIPTQGKNSMLPCIIKGFTLDSFGSTIVVPAEITTQSGADYDIDKVYVEMKHFEYDGNFNAIEESLETEEGIDNIIVNTHFDVLTSPLHFNELITPNNSDTLLRLMEEIAPIYETKSGNKRWSSISTQDDFREKNQAGGIFIGIASIANTAHALFGELGVNMPNYVTINGKEVSSLGEKYNSLGELISDNHSEIQTAAVDNAKTPILGHLNINHITSSAFIFLVEAGAGLQYSVKLLNTPVIKDLINRTRSNEATMGKEGAFQSALKNVTEGLGIKDMAAFTKDADITEAILDESLNQAKKGKMSTAYDVQILQAFLTFRRYGNDLNTVTNALKTDNNGARQTLAANIIDRMKLEKVQGTYSNALFKKQYPNDELDTVKTIVLDREKYKNHSIQAYEVYGLLGAIDIVSRVIDDHKPVLAKVLKDFSNNIGGAMYEGDIRMLMSDFYTYLYTNSNARTDGKTNTLSVDDSNEIAFLFMGEDSVGKRLKKFQNEDLVKASEDITHIPNEFVQNLEITLDDRRTGYDLVNFNNSISKSLTSEQKTMLSSEFLKMLNSSDPEIARLGEDMFLYNIYSEGFGRGINSFGDIIPVELFEEILNNDGSNLVDYFREISKDFTDIQSFNIDEFEVLFLQNRGLQLKGLKNLSKLKSSDIKDFLKANPKVNYFISNLNGKPMLSVRNSTGGYDGVFDLSSIPKNMIEYQSGDTISNSDIFQQLQMSKDLETNKMCSI